MKKKLIFLMIFVMSILNVASELTVNEILEKIDENMIPKTTEYEAEMIISRPDRTTTKRFKSYTRGDTEAFIEFTYPPRDSGTKYLRIEKDLWMYLPGASRTVKISGHMLRQSMMGSDFSYEDQTENRTLNEQYNAKILQEAEYNDREVYIIKLEAKDGVDPVYYMQKIWVDKEKFIYYKAELYGRSQKLLKTMHLSEYKNISDRYYPVKMKIEDNLRDDYYTKVIMKNLKLDTDIPDHIFTLRNLERK
ncbi:MAG: outer membrane lipoprotein-sorting protein [Candidatus Muiribacteriota bacterium]